MPCHRASIQLYSNSRAPPPFSRRRHRRPLRLFPQDRPGPPIHGQPPARDDPLEFAAKLGEFPVQDRVGPAGGDGGDDGEHRCGDFDRFEAGRVEEEGCQGAESERMSFERWTMKRGPGNSLVHHVK